ncbi:MAG: hypothetical protein ACO1PB_07570 [Ramlibacter sp.]
MSKRFFHLAFAVGLAAVLWVGSGFIGASLLALAMTAAIAAAYLLGAFELRQFRAGTAALSAALGDLAQPQSSLDAWLERVPASLRHAVRLRIEGERGGGLPGPALTPYLVGLLVMLGMLGTFLGMVITFQGAVFALEGSTDLQAIRSALAAPLKGLGLSFGTSVAGVAASAMLGLMSAIARRERLEVARRLDERIATVLLPFSLVHQRQETFRALQAQARSLPDVGAQLVALMEKIDARGAQLDAKLLERHDNLQRDMTQAYDDLARRVGASLQESLAAGARSAGESIAPVIESAMHRMAADAERTQERLQASAARQADAFAQQLGALQDGLARNLATLGASLEQPIARMLRTAAEVPQAAAGVIGELRQEMARLAERENLALQERTQLLGQLGTLLASLDQAASGQRAASEAMLASASASLQQAGARFAQAVDAQAGKAADAAAQVGGSAIEVSALAQAFQQAVQQFHAGSEKLADSLQKVEAALQRSTARSDEQLAYYVAQAREVIDLSISSQQAVLQAMRATEVQPQRARA